MCDSAERPHVLNLIVQHCLAQAMQKRTGSRQSQGREGSFIGGQHREALFLGGGGGERRQMLLCLYLASKSLE